MYAVHCIWISFEAFRTRKSEAVCGGVRNEHFSWSFSPTIHWITKHDVPSLMKVIWGNGRTAARRGPREIRAMSSGSRRHINHTFTDVDRCIAIKGSLQEVPVERKTPTIIGSGWFSIRAVNHRFNLNIPSRLANKLREFLTTNRDVVGVFLQIYF